MGAVISDRIDRLIQWQKFVLTEAGRDEFLQRLTQCGNIEHVCQDLDLPVSRVLAFMAYYGELSEAADRAMKLYAHTLVAGAVEIADAKLEAVYGPDGRPLVDEDGAVVTVPRDTQRDTFNANTKFKAAKFYHKQYYGDAVEVKHSGTVTFSHALQDMAARRLAAKQDRVGASGASGMSDRVEIDVTPGAVSDDGAVL